MTGGGFFSRIFGARPADEDETRIYSAEEIDDVRKFMRREPEEERQAQGFTAERAAGIIDDLPPDVPRESAVRIVRGTLEAAGIEFEDLERSTRMREAKLNSEMDFARSRQEDLRERTEEAVRALEDEIDRAEEARDSGIAEEDENISRISTRLKEIHRVRAFFGFPNPEEVNEAPQDQGQVPEPQVQQAQGRPPGSYEDADQTQVLRGPLSDAEDTTQGGRLDVDPKDTR